MSKRYGRNQKRAHRARIAALEEAHQRESRLASHLGAEVSRLKSCIRDWDAEITRLLGAYSAFRSETPVVDGGGHIREMPVFSRIPLLEAMYHAPSEEVAVRQRMYAFIVECNRDPDRFKTLIRFVERDRRTDAFHYMLSEELYHMAGWGERDPRYIADRVAHEIIRASDKGKVRR